jgi:hypothetical protein
MKCLFKNKRGQILVEYMLLMTIAIGFATFLTKSLIHRSDADTGMIIKAWDGILRKISNDLPDCHNQQSYSTPNCPP